MGKKLLIWTWILLPGCWALQGPTEVSSFPGGSLEVPCKYEPELVDANKYWCRGSSWLFCSILIQTMGTGDLAYGDRVSLQDDPTQHVFVVTMEDLREEDGGQYWCGIQATWYDPMFPVMVSILPVPTATHYDLHTTQVDEATSASTFPWTPLELGKNTSTPQVRTLQTGTRNLLVSILAPSTALVLGIIICHRMRRASLEKSRGVSKTWDERDPNPGPQSTEPYDPKDSWQTAQDMERKKDKDLQVTARWEQAAASSNIYMNREWELSLSEHDYENSPAKWQDLEKGYKISVSRAPEPQPIYMNRR